MIKDKILGAVLDAPVYGTGGLALIGVPVEWWIAGLAIVYGVVRITFVATEFYWKWRDRQNERKQSTTK